LRLLPWSGQRRAGRPGSTGAAALNYRHHFHAGNFADIVKHATLLALLARLTREPSPLTVLDTHAGAGLYDLTGGEARKSREAERGIARLMADPSAPDALRPLTEAVRRLNPEGALRFYPGSPLLAVKALRKGDRYQGHELRPDDHLALSALLKREAGPVQAKAVRSDGYAALAEPAKGRRLVLIDPPFERGDEYAQILAGLPAALAQPGTVVAVWLPIKDLETLDAFVSGLEANGKPLLLAQARLRPLSDPLKMNGCAMTLLGDELGGLTGPLEEICGWTARTLGEGGFLARVEKLPPS
jgi:23S rRNA (adenine2030-N6)-methyltransferase